MAQREKEDNFSRRAAFVAKFKTLWWDMWFKQCFDALLFYTTWKERSQCLAPDVIVLLGGQQRLIKGNYGLTKVIKTKEDWAVLTCSITKEFRPRFEEPGLPFRFKHLKLVCPVDMGNYCGAA